MTETLRIVGLFDDTRRFETRQRMRNDASATKLRITPAARRFESRQQMRNDASVETGG